MANFTEYSIKERSVSIFLRLVTAKNKSLGERLTENRAIIRDTIVKHVQRIGIHAYAKAVYTRQSKDRAELDEMIDEVNRLMKVAE